MTVPPAPDAETDVLRPGGRLPVGPDGHEPEPGRQLGWGMLLAVLALIAVAGAIAAVYFATRDGDAGAAATTAQTTTTTATTAILPATQVFVPDVTGLKQAAATSRLGDAGLVPVVEFRPTKKATGLVVSQQPKAGKRAKRGANVTVIVDRGAPSVAIPDVTGMQAADATAKLEDAGLKAQTTQVTSTEAAPGSVVSQAPAAGEKAHKGAAVTLSIARAPAGATTAPQSTTEQTTTEQTTPARQDSSPPVATVPDLSGAQLQQATQALIDANLLATLRYVPGTDPLGTILAQSPAAGGSAKARSHVTLNLSSGPGKREQETVPDASGQSLEEAVSTMNAGGLRMIFEKLPVSSRTQVGKVVEQTPAAGQTAPQNAQVLVYIGVVR